MVKKQRIIFEGKPGVIEAQQFSKGLLTEIFEEARKIEQTMLDRSLGLITSKQFEEWRDRWGVRGKGMVSLFYEPSTRTRASFEMAMRYLGGEIVFSTENARDFSSAAKGETLEDTIRVLDSYLPDAIVMRHYEAGAAKRAAMSSARAAIINAGDGAGQHPTQALLDLYTIWRTRKRLDALKIAFVGDLAFSRVVRSDVYLLGKYDKVQIYFVSPLNLKIGEDIKEYMARHNIVFYEIDDLTLLPPAIDVIYQTRIQKERLGIGGADFDYSASRER
ncbi:MAG: hypothetical protein HY764_01660, partial [Candidatus Portnoybacteria bacterium]|nr:hypothetical protein [Candidatus Portnoybacteria bacterium]